MKSTNSDGARVRALLRRRPKQIVSILGVGILLVAGSLAVNASSAFATSYPTFAQVLAARHNEVAAKNEVTKIKGILASLNRQLTTANATAQKTGAAAVTAAQNYALAEDKEQTLKSQEAAAAARAAATQKQLAGYASALARGPAGGGAWSTFSLLLNGKSTGQLLNNIGAINQVSREDDSLLQKALSEQNTVKQLTAQAAAQAEILAQQKAIAVAAEAVAQKAAADLQTAVTAEAAHQQELTVDLAVIQSKYSTTLKQYEKGVAAAEAAGAAGVVDLAGWALPTVGVITSPYGYRFDPAQGYSWAMHYGDDIADGCLRPIYAAHSGTVTYSAIYSDYGNYIRIDHGGGVSTVYGHIANGKVFVHVGQHVVAGQNIAMTGSTGFSTGCHLYFGVSVNGTWVDPVPFMRARGITIG